MHVMTVVMTVDGGEVLWILSSLLNGNGASLDLPEQKWIHLRTCMGIARWIGRGIRGEIPV